MTESEVVRGDTVRTSPTARLALLLEPILPPVRDVRFWLVQVGVLALAVLHDVVLVDMNAHSLAGIPAPITSSLLLIPVIYAALNFGVRGGVSTAVWATVLIVPHWFFLDNPSPEHRWIEVGYLAVLNVVAVVVGQRVEREQRARHRAETALQAAQDAEARYYTLFDDQPAPVIITDASGVVVELNSAASALLTPNAAGHHLGELLGVDVDDLAEDHRHPSLRLTDPSGEQRLLVPTCHRLGTVGGTQLVQVVLIDVTAQERRQQEQRLFAGRLLHVQEEERRRLARELHDDPLQDLAYLCRALDDLGQHPGSARQLADQLQHTSAVATDAASALRKIIQGLRPPVLDDLGLVSALRQLTQEARRRTSLSIELKVSGEEIRLPPDLELAAYRIAQEALSNAIRHARATSVMVTIDFAGAVVLTVSDDGHGIASGGAGHHRFGPGPGLGLIGMRERVSMAGGSLEVGPHQPHGTRVRATLPRTPIEVPAATVDSAGDASGRS